MQRKSEREKEIEGKSDREGDRGKNREKRVIER